MVWKPIPEREEAKRLGQKRYFTGKPCINGHVCERQVLNHACIECSKVRLREYRKTSEKYRAWLDATKDERTEKYDKWREGNRQTYRSYARKHYQSNKEEICAKKRAYFAKHPEKVIPGGERVRLKKFGAVGTHLRKEARDLLKKQKHKCAYCGADLRKVPKHKDHIIALSRGGTNYINNIQWLCGPCNISKSARDPIEFARSRGLLV